MNSLRPAIVAVLSVLIIVCVQQRCIHTSGLEAREAFAQLQHSQAVRDTAVARETRVRDSAQQAVSERDAAWGNYVRDLQAKQQTELQTAARAAARRARLDVESRTGAAFLPEAPDTGSGKPPCEVKLTCSEAAAWQASDSLLRFQRDSVATVQQVAAAACSTRVATALVHQDSAHVVDLLQQPPQSRRVTLVAAAAIAAAVAALLWGWM